MNINGYCHPELALVETVFAEIMQHPEQRGAGLCVQMDGEVLVDLWAGFQDRQQTVKWQANTLVNVFSAGKPFAAVILLLLVAQGKLELDTPIIQYWPEFAEPSSNKAKITTRHLLSHQSGLAAISTPLPAELLFDWNSMVQAIQQQTPWWQPSSKHGYAPITYGWLTGELIRRITGKMPGDAIKDSICDPLNLDFHIGLTDQEFYRVSDVSRMKGEGDAAAQQLIEVMLTQPESVTSKAFTNPPSVMSSTNKPEWRRMQQPAANGHGTAKSLAAFYQALMHESLLPKALLQEMTQTHSIGNDDTLLTPTHIGLGVMLDQPQQRNASFAMGENCFGHPGAGGTIAFAEPDKKLSFAFVTNSLGPYLLMDPRAQTLAQCVDQLIDH